MHVKYNLKEKIGYRAIVFLSETMSRTTFLNVDDTKAGMEDLDKEKINRLIQEASKSREAEDDGRGNVLRLIRFQIFQTTATTRRSRISQERNEFLYKSILGKSPTD